MRPYSRLNLLRACLLLFRGRFIAGSIVAIASVVLTLTIMGANFCDCLHDSQFRSLLIPMAFSDILCLTMAVIFGSAIAGSATAMRAFGAPNEVRFLLTRPISRIAIQFYPLAISVAAMALLPVLSCAVILGGMAMLHVHALENIALAARLIPAVAALGPHPSFLQVISALDVGRRYFAALSVGLAMYGPLAAQRWFLLNRHKSIRIVGGFTALMIPLPMVLVPFMIKGSSFVSGLLLLPLQQGGVTYLPSRTAIALHLAFAAAWICGTFFALREIEA
jgi:hypothetical protein